MKFTKITGENFKKYDSITFEPKKTTVAVLGHNGSGKTTLTQLIKFALTGDCPDEAVKVGKDTMTATLEMVDESGCTQTWERSKSNSRPSKVKVNGKTATGKALASHIESVTGIPLDSIRLSSSSELIEAMRPEEFADFIMTYTPEKLDYEKVRDFMDDDLDPLVYKILENGDFIPLTGEFGYEQLQETYNKLFETRKTVRAELASYEAKLSTAVVTPPKYPLNEINEKLETLLKEEGGYVNARKALELYEKALESRAIQEKQVKELEAKLASMTVTAPDANAKATLLAKKSELNNSIVSLKATIATLQRNIETFKNTILNLDKPMCPLSEGLVCKTDKSAKKHEFEEQITANENSVKTITAEIADKQKQYEEITKQELELNEQDKLYREKVLVSQQLDNLKKSMVKIPEKPVVPVIPADLAEQKENLYKLRSDVAKYEQYEKDFVKCEELKTLKAVYDTLVKLFAPKGDVTLKVTKHYFSVFEDVCNGRAAELRPGFSLKFVPEDGIKILCETAPGVGYIPYQVCSSGERAFVVFLIADLISCALTQTNILILDDLDKLDNEAFESLMNCVMQPEVQSAYDHIILCAVDHEDTKKILDKYSDVEQILI